MRFDTGTGIFPDRHCTTLVNVKMTMNTMKGTANMKDDLETYKPRLWLHVRSAEASTHGVYIAHSLKDILPTEIAIKEETEALSRKRK